MRHYARLAIFGYILCNIFGEGSNSADSSDRLANLIMILVEHCKNYEILFQNVFGHRVSVNLRNAHYILIYDFLFYVYPCTT